MFLSKVIWFSWEFIQKGNVIMRLQSKGKCVNGTLIEKSNMIMGLHKEGKGDNRTLKGKCNIK